ncbi:MULTISPECIES: SLAC1 anion channel family protein [Halorhodospira]|uniref:SLAC1 anion channel family protein n=1 Tax=Halorhodospira TaxID=85108 RepID=UPI00191413BD|nr:MULTISPECIES: SLAC1 anion channel family protein [Halorhodospira]MCG5529007.1 SLAC1 anion channel family protein [Halorhodospira halophila]MCG5544105.1 SLAC1 anion channel family protein [Halorhodospira sp. 9628]
MSQEENARVSLAHLPLPLFAATMGLAGLAMVWNESHSLWGWPAWVAEAVVVLAVISFVAMAAGYALKAALHPSAAWGEVTHPVRLNFLPAVSISLILLGIVTESEPLSTALWGSGALLHLILMLAIVTSWMQRQLELGTLNPVWFIPAVGNVLVPIPAAQAGYMEVAWFFFSIGLFFWLILMTLVYYRLIFAPNLPAFLLPTLFVLLAPPAAGYLAWVSLLDGGDPGVVGRLLYYKALFTFLLLLIQVPRLVRLPYYPSWWAYTFPLAAFCLASQHFVQAYQTGGGRGVMLLVVLTTLVIAVVFVATVIKLLSGKLLRPE